MKSQPRDDPAIADDEVDAFWRDGAICLRAQFGADWLAAVAEAIERAKAEPGPMVRRNTPAGSPGEFFVDFQLWQRFEPARRFVFDSPAAAIMARMLRADAITFYHDHLLLKEPGTGEPTPWHHDQPYYPIDGEQIGSIWLPLDPVPRQICVEYIAGSHRWGHWFRPRYFNQPTTPLEADDPRWRDMPDIEAERGRHQMLAWDLEPGDCIVFHALTVHGAPGNPTQRRRRAYATRWLGPDARYAARPGQISPPIEGHGLVPGDAVAGPLFPRVWPRAAP